MKAYVFQAALICEDCAHAYERDNFPPAAVTEAKLAGEDYNSDLWPVGPYSNGGGEADCPQHCDMCGVFLENPLTGDGYEYVREEAAPYERGDGDQSWQEAAELAEADGQPVLGEWIRFYLAWD